MKEKQDLWWWKRSKGKILKVHQCVVGGKFKGWFDQQRVGTLKSFNAHTVEPRWPPISVEVRDAEENDTTLPSAEHEGADDGWARLWFLRPVNQHSYLTSLWHHVLGPRGCECLEKPRTAGGGFSFRTLKRQRAACYRSSIMLNTLLVPPLGEVHGVTSGSAQWQHGKWGNLYVCECFFFFTPQSAQDGTTQSETYEWNKGWVWRFTWTENT